MKKAYKIIGVILLFCLLIAVGIMMFLKKNKVKNDVMPTLYIGDLGKESSENQNYWSPDNHKFAKADNGYYYTGLGKYGEGQYLYFFDEEKRSSFPVCSRADCGHNDSSCDAFFNPEEYMVNTIYYYRDYVYLIRLENGMAVLVRVASDGSSRVKVAELFPNSEISGISLVFHEDDVFVYDSIGHSGSTTEEKEVLKRISLVDGTQSVVYEYTGIGGAIVSGRDYGSRLFFIVQNYVLEKEEMKHSVQEQLYAYDYETGQTERVSEEQITDYYIDTMQDRMYYFVMGKGLYSCTLDGRNQTLLLSANNELLTGLLSYDGQYLYLYNGGIGSLTDALARAERKIYVLEKNGNIIRVIDCEKSCTGVFFGDSKYLFIEQDFYPVYMDKNSIVDAQWQKIN